LMLRRAFIEPAKVWTTRRRFRFAQHHSVTA
jgi:hypothetical protein